MSSRLLLAVLLLATACPGEEVDPAGLPPIAGYEAWPRWDFHGNLAGHGDSFRSVYVNGAGTSFLGVGKYPIGTVIVKEVRSLTSKDGQPAGGGIQYRAIMRKVGANASVKAPVDNGWVFTQLEGGTETHLPSCWASCHRTGPVDGTFFNYGE